MADVSSVLKKAFPLKLQKKEVTEKIGLISIGSSLVIIMMIIFLFFMYTKQSRMKQLSEDGFDLTRVVAGSAERGLKTIEANSIIQLVHIMGRKSSLVYGMIMDINGRVISHTNVSLVNTVFTDPVALRSVSSNNPLKQNYKERGTNHTIHEFSRPVYIDGHKAGVVRLGFSPDATPLFSDSEIRGILLMATLFFSLVPIFYYLVRRALGSIASLNDELKNLLTNDDFKKVKVNSADATGELVDKFNKAVSRLQDRYNMLKVSNDDLDVANRVLSYEKERTEAVIDNINDGILVTDSVGSIILVNSAMAYLMKFSREEVIGKTIHECVDNKDILSFIEKNQFNGRGFAQKNEEITLNQFGGENIVLLSYSQLLGASESVMGSIITTRDITVEKMTQQNQSDFIAHVAHELRTPLTTIKSYVEMLMDGEVNDQETKIDFFNIINEEANRLSRLIGNLLNITKIEMGNLTIKKDLIKSKEFLADIVKSIESQAISKGIKLESDLPDKLSPLVMEKDLLRVAILNILGNAIKYTPEGGSVTFSVEDDESHMKIDIKDTGYGISKEELPYVFDKFFRSSDGKIKEHIGNGLGLALTKEIIRLHDGKVDVESTIGEGSHFTIHLPKEDNPRIGDYSMNYGSLVDN